MTGSVRDVVTSGNARLRAHRTAERSARGRHQRSRASRGARQPRHAKAPRPPRAIAFANNTVYVLGEKLYTYSPSDLSKGGEQLTSYVTDLASGVTYVDQHLRADGGCIALTGRQFSPQFLNGSSILPRRRSPPPRPDDSSPRNPARSTSSPTTRSRSGPPSRCRRSRATAQRGDLSS